jgi:Gram-negative bacterial TonB protein C-terminal
VVEVTHPAEDPGLAIRSFDGSLSSLDVFGAEAPDARSSIPADPVAEHPQVSVGTVLAARIVFDPVDVVAVGQALCRAFIGAQMRRQLNPSLDVSALTEPIAIDSVFIDASGRVRGSVGNLDDEPAAVQAIGQVLSEILPRGNRSILKSKVISKAVASPPGFASVDELLKALETFAGSNGRELLRGVYELWRGHATPPDAISAGTVPEPLTVVPPQTPPPQQAVETKPSTEAATASVHRLKQSRQLRILLVSAVIVGGLGIVGVTASLLFNRGAVSLQSVNVSTPANAATPAPPSAKNAAPPQTLAAGRDEARPTSAMPTRRSTSANRLAMGVLNRRVGGTAISSAGSPRQSAVETLPMIATSIDISVRPLDPAERNAGAAISQSGLSPNEYSMARTARSVSSGEVTSSETSMPPIYGKDDSDVLPPKPLLPRLLAGLTPSSPRVRLEALTIAVIVNEDGNVDSVRGVVAPQNLSESLLLTQALSMVKSWRFSPAMRDGEPVKYKQIVPLKDLAHPGL